jgi:hypothetical protein
VELHAPPLDVLVIIVIELEPQQKFVAVGGSKINAVPHSTVLFLGQTTVSARLSGLAPVKTIANSIIEHNRFDCFMRPMGCVVGNKIRRLSREFSCNF